MTVGSALRAFWRKKLTTTNWEKKSITGIPRTNRPQYAVLDSPGALYKVGQPGSREGGTKLNDLIAVYTNWVQNYFSDNQNAHTFILMFDAQTPIAKYVNQKLNVAVTPLEEKHHGEHRLAWEDYFRNYATMRNTSLEYMLNYIAKATDPCPSVFDYQLPEHWHSLLGNRAFKEYVSWLICVAVFHYTRVPEGRTLVVLGPNYGRQRTGNTVSELDEKFQFEKYEVDFAVPYLASRFAEHDCVVFSVDGDVVLNLAYTRASQLSSPDGSEFNQNVFIVTKQITKKDSSTVECEYVDINEFWLAARNYMLTQKTGDNRSIIYPVETFCTLCILCCGHDYVTGFPRVGPVNLFKGFEKTVASGVCRFLYKAGSANEVQLDAASYFQLMLNSYKSVYPAIQYPNSTKVGELLDAIRPYLRKSKAEAAELLTVEYVRNVLANLLWTLHYILTSYDGVKHEPGNTLDSNGAPKYGFAASCNLTASATYNTWRPDNTSIAHLRHSF